MTAVFVTSTGTDIGKTFVTRGLIGHLREQGRTVDALKPVSSGFEPAEAEGSDAGLLLSALGRPVTMEEIARIAPWRFSAPVSPEMAARRENRRIDFAAVVDFCRRAVGTATDALFIEGVGGIMVPLDDRHTVLDWMVELDLPLILVSGSYLGTISHTLAALDVLGRRKLKIAVVVVSETKDSPVSLQETVGSIARFASMVDVVALPRSSDGSFDRTIFAHIAARCEARARAQSG